MVFLSGVLRWFELVMIVLKWFLSKRNFKEKRISYSKLRISIAISRTKQSNQFFKSFLDSEINSEDLIEVLTRALSLV